MTAPKSVAINHAELERLAREMCDARNGTGHFEAKGTKRNHWRALACAEIERRRSISLADAFMGIFGLRRVA
jgi:hypothetical protein